MSLQSRDREGAESFQNLRSLLKTAPLSCWLSEGMSILGPFNISHLTY